MSPIARGCLGLLALIAAIVLSIEAFAGELTRSHACRTIDDAQTLANHLIENEWVGYQELFNSLEAEDRCAGVLIPVPAPSPPIWAAHSETFDVGIFLLMGENGVVYGLLLGRYTRLSAS